MKNIFLAIGNIILGSILIYAAYTATLDDGIKAKAETPTPRPTVTATQTARPTGITTVTVHKSGNTETITVKTGTKTTYQKHEILEDGTIRSYPIQEQEEVQQSGVSTAGVVPGNAHDGIPTDY